MNGVVAAGHPLTAEAGAEVLREGGNAVDAAVAAVLASFAVESPLTGFGAGGFMMVSRGEQTTLIDFFVAAPGKDGIERGEELVPVPVHFDEETVQTFYVGPASCGVPGTAAGLEQALARFGTAAAAELTGAAVKLAREGAPVNAEQAYILEILWPIHQRLAGTRQLYAPGGRSLIEGDIFRFGELAEALERFGAEGAEPFYRGEVAAALSGFMAEHGGTLGATDLAEYEAIERRPIQVPFRGTEVLTNPPPSSGGILIAHTLGLLERLGPAVGTEPLEQAERVGDQDPARGGRWVGQHLGPAEGHLDRSPLDRLVLGQIGGAQGAAVLGHEAAQRRRDLAAGEGLGALGAEALQRLGQLAETEDVALDQRPSPRRVELPRPGQALVDRPEDLEAEQAYILEI